MILLFSQKKLCESDLEIRSFLKDFYSTHVLVNNKQVIFLNKQVFVSSFFNYEINNGLQ